MTDKMLNLNDRPIIGFGWINEPEEYNSIYVGRDGITKIDCSEQFCGDYSIFWLQVWNRDQLVARFNVKNVDNIQYISLENK